MKLSIFFTIGMSFVLGAASMPAIALASSAAYRQPIRIENSGNPNMPSRTLNPRSQIAHGLPFVSRATSFSRKASRVSARTVSKSSKEWKVKIRSAREKRLNALGIPQGRASTRSQSPATKGN